jgi:site-specific recombinase XerD
VQESRAQVDQSCQFDYQQPCAPEPTAFLHTANDKHRRYVPLSYRVRDLLRAQGATSIWVFSSLRKKGLHISYFPIAKQFSMVRRALDLSQDLVLYSARHTFATDMLDKTGNLSLVQKMLGHESITTTQRHVHPE